MVDPVPPDAAVGDIAAAVEGAAACAPAVAAGRTVRSIEVAAVAGGGGAEGSTGGTIGINQSTVTAPSAKAKRLAAIMRTAGRTQSAQVNVAR